MWPILRQLLPVFSANVCSPLIPSAFPHSFQLPSRTPATAYRQSLCSAHRALVAQVSEELATDATALTPNGTPPVEGPVELPPSVPSIFATSDDPTPLQTATSVLLTGAITVFLFRSLRRRAKSAKETKLRSAGEKKSLKEEALESLKAVSLSPVKAKSKPSPVQAFLGAVGAAVIALILYKFTTTIEASLNRQTISDNYSVRQITITIRTIINGLCYLATFVFGVNALGLFLYSGQLAMDSFMDGGTDEDHQSSPSSSNSQSGDSDDAGIESSNGDQSVDDTES